MDHQRPKITEPYANFFVYNAWKSDNDTEGKVLYELQKESMTNSIIRDGLYSIWSEFMYIGEDKHITQMYGPHLALMRKMKIIRDTAGFSGFVYLLQYIDVVLFVRLCRNGFNIHKKEKPTAYGGRKWANICTAWLNMYKYRTDHHIHMFIHLSHNTGNVLNKIIPNMDAFLSLITFANNPFSITKFCSGEIEQWARKRIKQKTGLTIQASGKTDDVNVASAIHIDLLECLCPRVGG